MVIDRRLLLKHAAALPLFGTVPPFAWAAGENEAVKADCTLRIAPVTLELAPGQNHQNDRLQRHSSGAGLASA
jgi:hypothetical protein